MFWPFVYVSLGVNVVHRALDRGWVQYLRIVVVLVYLCIDTLGIVLLFVGSM